MSAASFLVWLAVASGAATGLVGGLSLVRERTARLVGARAALWLWCAPALRLILPPLGLGVFAWGTPLPDPVAPPADAVGDAAAPAISGAELIYRDYTAMPASLVGADAPAEPLFAVNVALLLAAVWAAGAIGALVAQMLASASWRRTLLAEGGSAGDLRPALTRAKHQAGYTGEVALVRSGAAASPQVLGLVRPMIALPLDFAERFDAQEQDLALLHEVTHLARRDLWLAFAADVLCALHWFNPFLRRARPIFRADQEAACDEAVRAGGASTPAYAGTLLRAARAPVLTDVPALTLNHDLKRRIETMTRPLPKTARRLIGTASVAALACGVAAATQDSGRDRADDPNAMVETGQDDQNSKTTERSTFSWSSDEAGPGKDGGSVTVIRSGDTDMVLLSDPFAALTPATPQAPPNMARIERRREGMAPPTPPSPPKLTTPSTIVVVGEDGKTKRTIALAPGEKLKTEGGGDVIIVPTIDRDSMAALEIEMEAFAEEMEAYEGEMGEMTAAMEAFGEDMGAWGEKMGEVGAAVGELAERCQAHRERTVKPTILSVRVEATDETIKAACARGGKDRYRGEEMRRFVERQGSLTDAEKAAYAENIERGGLKVSVN